MNPAPAGTLPPRVFEAPLLRGLDAGARALLQAAARVRTLADGQTLYRVQDDADTIFVVAQGCVALHAVRRGDQDASVLREARAGDTVGEEAVLELPRRATAVAVGPAVVVEFGAALFRRGAGRSGETRHIERESRQLVRTATTDLLRTIALTRDLADIDFDMVLDAVQLHAHARGDAVYRCGERADAVYLVVDGLIQLQTEDDDRIAVAAYLTRGDAFGDEDLMGFGTGTRTDSAISLGHSRTLQLPADVFRTLVDRNPSLRDTMACVSAERHQRQQDVVGEAAARATRHVFHDLYRMQMARSLLVIDQDSCVRCGHCAWSCAATHDDGVSRLVRRGDKVVTRLDVLGPAPKSLLIPNSCQHCKNPACMVDCPTGAIGRDLRGEVFIREALCTGCGNCAKACPWENIQLAPRGGASVAQRSDQAGPLALSAEVAVKCDLCRGYEGPACVQACPTDAITRLDPNRDVAEVAAVLGVSPEGPQTSARRRGMVPVGAWLGAIAAAAGITGWRLQAQGVWTPGDGPGAYCGWAALGLLVVVSLYVLPKRWPSLWMRRRARVSAARAATGARSSRTTRSKLRPLMALHSVLGAAMAAAVAAHAGPRWPGGVASALMLVFAAVTALGIVGAVVYRVLPGRLSRLEREGALPEDLVHRGDALVDRLYKEASGRSDLVKALADKVLRPYARSGWASVMLFVSGRSLRTEQARLRARLDRLRQGRGEAKLDGLDAIVRTVVEIRALPVRRGLQLVLRGWLPVHIVASAVLWVLVAAHVVVSVGGP